MLPRGVVWSQEHNAQVAEMAARFIARGWTEENATREARWQVELQILQDWKAREVERGAWSRGTPRARTLFAEWVELYGEECAAGLVEAVRNPKVCDFYCQLRLRKTA